MQKPPLLCVSLALLACAGVYAARARVRVLEAADAPSLYEQSYTALLARRFTSPDVSYMILDARTKRLLGARWNEPERPIPMGSLVKPFTALAYGEAHGFTYPEYICRGKKDGCWLPRGHGRIGLDLAIAYSCNAYFRRLAADVRPENELRVAQSFAMAGGAEPLSRGALIGLGSEWRVAPLEAARAYCELAARRSEPGVGEVMDGLELSAEMGTGRAVATALRAPATPIPRVLTKTGTAPCVHRRRAPGDGYTVVLWPADSPRYALLVGVHGVPGARAAAVAGEMLRVIETGE